MTSRDPALLGPHLGAIESRAISQLQGLVEEPPGVWAKSLEGAEWASRKGAHVFRSPTAFVQIQVPSPPPELSYRALGTPAFLFLEACCAHQCPPFHSPLPGHCCQLWNLLQSSGIKMFILVPKVPV